MIETNRHHVHWERNGYKTNIERRIRNMGAFVIKMEVPVHDSLHRHLPPPPKLRGDQYHDLYNFMQDRLYKDGTPEGLEWAIAWAEDRRLDEYKENVENQLFYVDMGFVREVYFDK